MKLLSEVRCIEITILLTLRFSTFPRQQDVRAMEIDKVDLFESFRAGDVIQAQVVSLHDVKLFHPLLRVASPHVGISCARIMAPKSIFVNFGA